MRSKGDQGLPRCRNSLGLRETLQASKRKSISRGPKKVLCARLRAYILDMEFTPAQDWIYCCGNKLIKRIYMTSGLHLNSGVYMWTVNSYAERQGVTVIKPKAHTHTQECWQHTESVADSTDLTEIIIGGLTTVTCLSGVVCSNDESKISSE